ncbi:hypothetical protein TNCV_3630801 [Trichonephila clavipes]|nr:hypothetical protein TNCV_3630801 [Trichonephila clavipes]
MRLTDARPRIRCSRRKQFFPKLYASSGTMAQTLKGSYLGKLPLWPNDPLYPCRDFRYDPEHKKMDVTVQFFCGVYAE